MEARGLWRMKGDFMGGPYVSHTRLDEKNQRKMCIRDRSCIFLRLFGMKVNKDASDRAFGKVDLDLSLIHI